MNAIIAILSFIAITVILRGFIFYAGRVKEIKLAQARDDAYEERWASWGEWTKIDH